MDKKERLKTAFDLEVPDLSNREAGNFLKRDRVMAQDFFGGWCLGAVLARTAVGFDVFVQRQVQVSILADASDESSPGWQPLEQDLIGVAAIDADEQWARVGIRALIEVVAEIDNGEQSDLSKGESLFEFSVLFPLQGRGVLFRFRDGWCGLEADGQSTSGTVAVRGHHHH